MAEEELQFSEVPIQSFKIFTLPNCDKCAAAKEYLSPKMQGQVVDLSSDEGLKEFREVYKTLKGKIRRDADGSLPVPTILLYDKEDNLITVANTVDDIKQIVQ